LLDFACGAGFFLELAQQRGWEGHGTEVGEWAKQLADARGVKNLHIGQLQELGFENNYFDVVHAAQVFEHLPTPKYELQEIRRILKPGGLLYIDVPNYRTLPILAGRDDFMLNEPPQHVNYFTPRSLRRLADAGGFTDIRITSWGGLKWENLLGRQVNSNIASAYGLVSAPAESPSHSQAGGALRALKQLALASLVKPVLYDRLKVGMGLMLLANR
jgi:SAM-dependent methyltransferase